MYWSDVRELLQQQTQVNFVSELNNNSKIKATFEMLGWQKKIHSGNEKARKKNVHTNSHSKTKILS